MEKNFTFLFSETLFQEFINVTERPKIKKYFKTNKLVELINNFECYGEMVQTSSSINICRDPRDNFLLDLAVDGNANYLVSGDDDLLSINTIKTCQIISLNQFKEIIHE